jgi:15-cis-phytoene synthase
MNPEHGSLPKKTNFYYAFLLLSAPQRKAMETLYRFCWTADEISDSIDPLPLKKKKLGRFRKELNACFSGKSKESLFEKMGEVIEWFQLSKEPFFRILQGVEKDMNPVRFRKFAELHQYALQVAGGPGLASMEIFGFKDKPHQDYAENLAVFLQIVNVVRDFQEDKALNRLYFPAEDFKRFHLNPYLIDEKDSLWKPFVEFQLNRAWGFLEKSRQSLSRSQRAGLMTAEAIAAVYLKLFQKLKNDPYLILKGRTTLSKWDKLLSMIGVIGRCWLWKWTATDG